MEFAARSAVEELATVEAMVVVIVHELLLRAVFKPVATIWTALGAFHGANVLLFATLCEFVLMPSAACHPAVLAPALEDFPQSILVHVHSLAVVLVCEVDGVARCHEMFDGIWQRWGRIARGHRFVGWKGAAFSSAFALCRCTASLALRCWLIGNGRTWRCWRRGSCQS